jgi:hypothetical protein
MKKVRPIASVDNVLVNASNLANGNTSYSYFDLLHDHFRQFSLQMVLAATTVTIEASNESKDVDDSSKSWVDVTSALTNGVTASFTAGSHFMFSNTPALIGRVRIKRVTTNATNSCRILLCRAA